jgi:hypothetical protein
MAGFSQYLALAVFNATLNPSPTALTPPSGLWVALHTAEPNDTTYGSEANYSGYQRSKVDSLTASVQLVGNLSKVLVTNNRAITFNPSTDGTDTTITHWSIWDASNPGDGNMLYSGEIVPARIVAPNDWVVIPEGNVSLEIA